MSASHFATSFSAFATSLPGFGAGVAAGFAGGGIAGISGTMATGVTGAGGVSATALLAGEVTVSFNTIPSALAYVKAGRLRAIGVSSLQRSISVPDIPTIAEMGYPGFSASGLAGLLAPAGTPAEAIERINAEVVKLLKRPAVVERCVTLGLDPVGDTPAEFARFIKADMEKWTRLTRELNLGSQ